MNIVEVSLIVFTFTLLVTKSKIFACKRIFVSERYNQVKVFENPCFLHEVWNAIWNCSMCSGFWFAIPVCLIFPVHNIFADILIVFGLNWLWHCIENILFNGGELLKELIKTI